MADMGRKVSWAGTETKKTPELVAALLVKWKAILTGLHEIHCCCSWRAPKAPPMLHKNKIFWQ